MFTVQNPSKLAVSLQNMLQVNPSQSSPHLKDSNQLWQSKMTQGKISQSQKGHRQWRSSSHVFKGAPKMTRCIPNLHSLPLLGLVWCSTGSDHILVPQSWWGSNTNSRGRGCQVAMNSWVGALLSELMAWRRFGTGPGGPWGPCKREKTATMAGGPGGFNPKKRGQITKQTDSNVDKSKWTSP